MNILIIDTATEACSVALTISGQTFSRFEVCPQQHSQRILPMIDALLAEANASLHDVDYLGFGQGPGSFTGVRIATGILQGLALGTGLGIVGVSTLAAMAQQAHAQFQSQQVVAAIDARMSEIYGAEYFFDGNIMQLKDAEQVIAPDIYAQNFATNTGLQGVGTGWAAYPELNSIGQIKVLDTILYPNALYMLPLAQVLIENGQVFQAEEIQPVYLRDKVTWKKLPGRE